MIGCWAIHPAWQHIKYLLAALEEKSAPSAPLLTLGLLLFSALCSERPSCVSVEAVDDEIGKEIARSCRRMGRKDAFKVKEVMCHLVHRMGSSRAREILGIKWDFINFDQAHKIFQICRFVYKVIRLRWPYGVSNCTLTVPHFLICDTSRSIIPKFI